MRRNLDKLRFVLFLLSFLLSDVIIWSFLQLTTIFLLDIASIIPYFLKLFGF